jgi:large subunit ribosomal protein L23
MVVKRPLLTEKGTKLKESGGRSEHQLEGVEPEKVRAKVLFEVAMDANKVEIRQAIEKLFNVRVADVHTQIVRGKEKRIGRWLGRRSNWKKAIVTLQEGNTIDFFEGV